VSATSRAASKANKAAAPASEEQREADRNAQKRVGRRSDANGSFILVRVRGTVNITGKIADTLEMLRLNRPMHAVVIPKTESYLGMVNRAKDYVAYGDVDAQTLAALIKARGRVMGDKPIDDAFVKTATENKYATIDAFAKAVAEGKATLKELGEDAKPVFRLNPPVGGFKGSTKKHFTVKGELGYRGKEINELIKRMM
jgi:large subunit ribosomal protein L30